MVSIVSITNALNSGELSPSLYGRQDLEKWHHGTSTCRNFFASYRGGALSRAGLAYVGTCKQPGTSEPPRDIPFQFSLNQGYVLEFGDVYMRIKSDGAYVTETHKTVNSVSNVGLFTTSTNHGYSVGDWVYDTGNTGFSKLTWIVHTTPSATTFTVTDLFGNVISSATASTTGTIARIYTVVAPYAAVDLPYLKYTQSADVMTLTCVNTSTNTEYPPYDLTRHSNTNWTFTQESFESTISPPTGLTVTAEASTTPDTYYSYVVTAVSASTGEESVASTPKSVQNNDISIAAGSNNLAWNTVAGASSYNIYKATPSYNQDVAVGVLYGYAGTALGVQFTDTNIVQDFTQVPPTHQDPFARGMITRVNITAGGSGYTQATVGYTITTGTGTNFAGVPIVEGGAITGFYIENNGNNYINSNTITFTDGGGGTGATGTLTVGAQSGTYPAIPAYFQQRRVYANTLNTPDTYFMSQPGLYSNMDSSIPVSDSDAITGTPWAQQVNGIQFLVPMPGGLVVLTGKGAWQVNGGSQAAITPSNQVATPQAYNGCNDIVPPITINYDILYVQSKGSIVRDLSYNFFVNIYTGTDLTVLSDHLFTNYKLLQWAWAEEPYKLIWVIRNDGTLLCLTYLKEQDVYSWTRHDTNGLFVGVCSVTEPPVDAVYVITKRYVQGAWRYYSERMDNRIWQNVEQSFCVDSGLSTALTYPNATLSPSAATGTNVSFIASSSVFTNANVGDVIRIGGGKATVTSYISGTHVNCTINQEITQLVPNDPNGMPEYATSGNWSISTPVTTITNLNHLNDLEVAILADGSVVPNQTVTNNQITLPVAASYVTVGLPYTCQLQSLYLDDPSKGGNTIQNRRKNIAALGVRVAATRGISIGADQPDASTEPNNANVPWTNMVELKQRTSQDYAGNPIPLFTGDFYQAITASWTIEGQAAVQQTYPLPANILSIIFYFNTGDDR